jgi:uncharacterized membrane protein
MSEATEELEDKVSPNGSDDESRSRLSGLGGKGVLFPVAAAAASAAAAGLAAKKGPDLMKKLQGEASEEGEEIGKKGMQGLKKGLASSGPGGKIASKLMGGGGGDDGGGGQKGGKTRRLPIQRWTDVAVPVDKAYQAWTQFEEFPKFMHRVLEVKKEDQNKIHWREKIWFSTREWDGEITERRKNDRIAWKSVSGTQHSGVISFHKLDSNLTRVLVTLDFVPSGILEKMASGMRFVKRAVEADLARFKAYVEFGDVKGLEYKSTPAEMEQNQGDEEDDESGDEQEAQGRGDDSGDDDAEDDKERDSDREDRAKRREERSKSLTSSS